MFLESGIFPSPFYRESPVWIPAPSGGFAPSDLPGVEYYGSASSLSLSDNDPIGSVANLSSGTGSAATASGSDRPTYKASVAGFNNKPVMRFGGANFMDGTVTMGTTKVWVFAVCTLSSGADSFGRLLSCGAAATFDYNNVAYSAAILRSGAADSIASYRNTATAGIAVTLDVPVLFVARYDGTNCYISVNGGSETSFSTSGTFNISAFRLGRHIGGTESWAGDVSALGMGTGDLSPTDISDLTTWTIAQYGI